MNESCAQHAGFMPWDGESCCSLRGTGLVGW